MTGLEFNQALRTGRRVYGTLVASTSPRWVPLLAGLPMDFVFIDTEHIPIDRAQLSWMTWAYRFAGLAPMVRIPSPNPFAACQVLDGGACAVVAPYVESAAEVRALVGAVKHRPLKGVTVAAALASGKPLTPALQDYVRDYNAANSLVVNIESGRPSRRLMKSGGSSWTASSVRMICLFLHPRQYDRPEFARGLDVFGAPAPPAGTTPMPAEQEARWCAAGANLVTAPTSSRPP